MKGESELSPTNVDLESESLFFLLPSEMMIYIVSMLDLTDRFNIAVCSQFLYKIANCNQLWKLECKKFNLRIPIDSKEEVDYRSLFISGITTNPLTTFYTVGKPIKLFRNSKRGEPNFPFPSKRNAIPSNEITYSLIASSVNLNVFFNEEQALLYGNSLITNSPSSIRYKKSPAIFEIKIKRQRCQQHVMEIQNHGSRRLKHTTSAYQLSFFKIKADTITEITKATLCRNSKLAIDFEPIQPQNHTL